MLDWIKNQKAKIAVIGDIMIDEYYFGNVERMSPEAPVPILSIPKNSKPILKLGGAANVAACIAKAGGNVYLVGQVGLMGYQEVCKLLDDNNINRDYIDVKNNYRTIKKVRFMKHWNNPESPCGTSREHLLRVDYDEKVKMIPSEDLDELLYDMDLVIMSDYGKGTCNKNVAEIVHSICKERNIKLIIDPKPPYKKWYSGVYCLTPNFKEALTFAYDDNISMSKEIGTAMAVTRDLCKIYKNEVANWIVTCGDNGSVLGFNSDNKCEIVPFYSRKVKEVDVCGAGDAFIATLGMCLAEGEPLEKSIGYSNKVASITVEQIGCYNPTIKDIEKVLKE